MRINFSGPFQHPDDGTGTGDKGDKGGEQKVDAGTIAGGGDGGVADGEKKIAAVDDKGGTVDAGKKKADGTADGEPKSKAGDTTPKAPEKYSLKLPDGGRLDESDLKTVEELSRANDYTNDEAQAFLDEQANVIAKKSEEYAAVTKADKDYGGAQLEQTQKLARLVVDRIRPIGHPRREGFVKFINRGGAGNHIEVVSFLADLGKQMAEDVSMGGLGGGGGEKSTTQKLYTKDE